MSLMRRFTAPAVAPTQQQQSRQFITILKGVIFGTRRKSAAQYVNYSTLGNVDPATAMMGSRQSDKEWQRVRLLALFCGGSTIGSSIFFTYFPEKANYFKDDPNSRFSR